VSDCGLAVAQSEVQSESSAQAAGPERAVRNQSCALKDYSKWQGSRRSMLTFLGILTKDRFKTHFVHLTTEYRPELRVCFQVSEQYDVPQIDSILEIRQALDEVTERYEQGTNKALAPTPFFILLITCSNVPNMRNIVPCAAELKDNNL
jgi:hypothetical protein